MYIIIYNYLFIIYTCSICYYGNHFTQVYIIVYQTGQGNHISYITYSMVGRSISDLSDLWLQFWMLLVTYQPLALPWCDKSDSIDRYYKYYIYNM